MAHSELETFKQQIKDAGLKVYSAKDTIYTENTIPWSLAHDKNPALLLVPDTVAQLQTAIKTLYPTNLSFAIRGRGCGSASASDILISLSAPDFQAINLIQHKNDSDNKGPIIDVSAGCNWGAVDAFVEKEAPGFAVVGARCPYVGVAGSTLTGGFSWLSHTYGLSSDPDNLLDVQILLHDGELVWAFTRPDLLWALRGGGANFGVAVTIRFRARPYPASVFAGLVFFPESAVREVSRRVAKWANDVVDEKMALHVFVVDSNPGLALHGGSATPRLMALMFDGNGEEHGRSGDGFGWLLGVPGAKEAEGENKPRMMSLREVHELQRGGQETHGKGCSWLEAALVGEGPDGLLDDDVLVRSWDWYLQVVREEPDLARGSFVLLEIMQRAAFTSGETPGDTAWPHGQNGRRHVLQLSTGCAPVKDDKLPDARRRALQLMKEAPAWISGKTEHPPGDFLPNFLLENHDVQMVFGENWDRLRQVKHRFDPRGRFNSGFVFPSG